jgi:4a-hydroxytetrahydrobiopterin dehydratase
MAGKLSENEIKDKLENLSGWDYKENKITKEFETKDFASALGFVVKVGIEAEKMDHHPDITMHSWNKVNVSITTHSAGGVTDNDFKLAENIDNL